MSILAFLILLSCTDTCGPADPLLYETHVGECVCLYKRVYPLALA